MFENWLFKNEHIRQLHTSKKKFTGMCKRKTKMMDFILLCFWQQNKTKNKRVV